jgi:hypothetical protein
MLSDSLDYNAGKWFPENSSYPAGTKCRETAIRRIALRSSRIRMRGLA